MRQDGVTSAAQGSTGNCAAVAAVKELVLKQGPNGIQFTKRADGGYDFKMQDGFTGSLSRGELNLAKTASKLNGQESPVKTYMQACIAAMAKRAQSQHEEGARTFEQGLASLNNGDDPKGDSAQLLGVSTRAPDGKSAVVWNANHAWQSINVAGRGWLKDQWGKYFPTQYLNSGAYSFAYVPPSPSNNLGGGLGGNGFDLRSLGGNAWNHRYNIG